MSREESEKGETTAHGTSEKKRSAQGFWSALEEKNKWSKTAVRRGLWLGGGEGADLLVPLVPN